MRKTTAELLGRLEDLKRAFTASEASSLGVPSWTLEKLTEVDPETFEAPCLTRIAHGIYLHRSLTEDGRSFLAEAALRFPRSLVSLRTAALAHGLTTEDRMDAFLAMPTAYRPKPVSLGNQEFGTRSVHWIRWNERSMTDGVCTVPVHGIPVSITSPMRTVVDYFRYQGNGEEGPRGRALFDRNEVLEVLDRYLAGQDHDAGLVEMAARFGVRGDIEPLLEGRRALTRRM